MCEKKHWNLIKHEGEVRMGKKRTRLYEAQEGVRAFASFSWEWFIFFFCYPLLWGPVGKSSSTTTWAPVKPTWTLPKSSQNILVPQVFRQIINFVPFLSFPVLLQCFSVSWQLYPSPYRIVCVTSSLGFKQKNNNYEMSEKTWKVQWATCWIHTPNN